MIPLAGYSYRTDKACIVCEHVLDGAPVLAFAHDKEGDLQFACGADAHTVADWHLIGLNHLDLQGLRLTSLPTVNPGSSALRESEKENWELATYD